MNRILSLICFAGVLVIGGVWYSQGTNLATLEKELVKTTKVDEFGDEVTEEKWEPTFKLGLDYAGPSMGMLIIAGTLLGWRARRESEDDQG